MTHLLNLAPEERLAAARAIRDATVAQQQRQIAEFEVWRPTPTRQENDLMAAHVWTLLKRWSLSPISPDAFDKTEPPGRPIPPTPPVCATLPNIAALAGLEVGDQLVGQQGTWTGSGVTFTRQWYRGALPIAGATLAVYAIIAPDVGYAIGLVVTATTNAGASSFASAAAVGPIVQGRKL